MLFHLILSTATPDHWIRDALAEFVVVLVAAFAGAWAGILFQERKEKRLQELADFRAAKLAQFTFIQQYTDLHNLLAQHLDPIRNVPQRMFKLLIVTREDHVPKVDLQALAFILDTADADLLNRVAITDSRFQLCVGTLNERNRIAKHLQTTAPSDGNTIALTPVEFAWLKTSTDNLFSAADDAMAANKAVFVELVEFIKRQFPNRKPLTFAPPEPERRWPPARSDEPPAREQSNPNSDES